MSLQSAKGDTGNVYLWLEDQWNGRRAKLKVRQWKSVISRSAGLSQSDNIIIFIIY
jgi:hypothetical protein